MWKLLRPLQITFQAFAALLSWWLAFVLRFEGVVPRDMYAQFYTGIMFTIAVRTFAYYMFGLHRRIWRYAGVRDLLKLSYSVVLGTVLLAISIMFLTHGRGFSRSILIIDFLLNFTLMGGVIFTVRVLRERKSVRKKKGRNVLVVGAGDAGEMIVREMLQKPERGYMPVAFADDDPARQGQLIHNVPVVGTTAEIPEIVRGKSIDEIVIAIPSASNKVLRKIFEYCRNSTAGAKALPSIADIIADRVTINRIRKVGVEDLLGREPVSVNLDEICAYISDQCLLVTGAGGSIGSELSRQIVEYGPSKLIILDHDENAMFNISRQLAFAGERVQVLSLVLDILNYRALESLFNRHKPDVVFHAAAHKHVPLMEAQVLEAVRNNVQGTLNLAELSHKYSVSRFVNISTDKAVEPVNIMGMTKRVGELGMMSINANSDTTFVSVRFGNVLGSAGSVIPIFEKQIAQGGPVTVTHPDMERFFMTVQEAVQLVIQTGAFADSGGIFILDMGKPVRIVKVAEDLIRFSGLEPGEDIEIQFTSVRPGEKLREKLYCDGKEVIAHTSHPKIMVVREQADMIARGFSAEVERLLSAVCEWQEEETLRILKKLSSYTSKSLLSSCQDM